MTAVDLLVIGSGPAGMSAAIEGRRHGLSVIVIDEQARPGGQIWRSIELSQRRDQILGAAYVEGRKVAEEFRSCGAVYKPGSKLWQIEPGYRAFASRDGRTQTFDAQAIVLATGAQERPIPFEGWTLPGVLTVGAAQILLKNAGQIPTGPVWIAGSGPLPLLYAVQLLRAGGKLAGYLDTTPKGQWKAALPHLPAALRSSGDLLKGLGWQRSVRKRAQFYARSVSSLAALGGDCLEALRFQTSDTKFHSVEIRMLLVHEGVVPSIHPAASLDCELAWNLDQDCFVPVTNGWGETTRDNLFVAGDGAGIAGAKAALLRGKLAALSVAYKLGRLDRAQADCEARTIRRRLDRALASRPFLDALFRPRREIFAPSNETIVCRCEEVTAGSIRASASVGCPGPNQVKATLRAGMGPCQGRQCAYTVTRLLAEAQNRPPSEVGFIHVRPPLKPITLGELASVGDGTCLAPAGGEHE